MRSWRRARAPLWLHAWRRRPKSPAQRTGGWTISTSCLLRPLIDSEHRALFEHALEFGNDAELLFVGIEIPGRVIRVQRFEADAAVPPLAFRGPGFRAAVALYRITIG